MIGSGETRLLTTSRRVAPGARRKAATLPPMGPAAGRALDGALAAASGLAAGEMLSGALEGARSPLTGVGKLTIDLTSPMVVDMTVATVEALDKPILRAAVAGEMIAAGAASSSQPRREVASAAIAGVGLASGVAAAARPESATAPSLGAGVAAALAGGGTSELLARRPSHRTRLLTAAVVSLAALAATALNARKRRGLVARRERVQLPAHSGPPTPLPAGAAFDVEGLSPLYTPPESFYVTDTQLPAPAVDPASWRLRVGGMVDRPLELTFDQLLALGPVELDATLVCVHNPAGGPRIGNARWLGVPVATLLEAAGVRDEAEQLVARAADGFTAGVPVEWIGNGSTAIVAVGMGGEPLPIDHGFPARLLVPGLWGADANTKWLTELELTTWDAVVDYWDRRGWPRVPTAVRPGSRIDVPANRAIVAGGPITLAGVAWAPPVGVESVEVSLDGGEWRTAEISTEVAPTMWRHWRLVAEIEPGEHRARVRTVGRARRQSGDRQPPYATGSSGFHQTHFEIVTHPPSAGHRLRQRTRGIGDDLSGRAALAAAAVSAWRARGYPPAPRFPSPSAVAAGVRRSMVG